MNAKKLTPILMVESIEASLPFWEALGFEITTSVPHEDALGFVILARGDLALMLQSFPSAEADVPAFAQELRGSQTILFIEVDSLDEAIAAVPDAPVVVPRRQTDYGADEIFVRDPAGHVVGLAQF
jgi:catechol 2,3-dioxygenase-like lactoylglutathione lyase family enzyme